MAIPGIVLGVGLFFSYTRPPFVLYGTLWILLIAFVTISMPAAYQQTAVGVPLGQSRSRRGKPNLGATRLGTLERITAPLLRTSVIATWCFIFVGVIRELSAAIMLFTSETKFVSVDLRSDESGDRRIAVLGLIMLVFTFAVGVAYQQYPRVRRQHPAAEQLPRVVILPLPLAGEGRGYRVDTSLSLNPRAI